MAIINQHSAFKKDPGGIQKTPINNSSFLMHYRYDAETEQLVVTFKNGGEYIYDQVDATIVDMWAQAPSMGKYYAESIKGKFPASRILDKTTGPRRVKNGKPNGSEAGSDSGRQGQSGNRQSVKRYQRSRGPF